MRLLLGTHSKKGLEVFRDVQGVVERTEIETRNRLRESNERQASLFSDDEIVGMQQNASGIGCPRFQKQSEQLIVDYLAHQKRASFEDISCRIMEAIPMRSTQIKDLMIEMKNCSRIEFTLPAGKRKPQPDTLISLTSVGGKLRYVAI